MLAIDYVLKVSFFLLWQSQFTFFFILFFFLFKIIFGYFRMKWTFLCARIYNVLDFVFLLSSRLTFDSGPWLKCPKSIDRLVLCFSVSGDGDGKVAIKRKIKSFGSSFLLLPRFLKHIKSETACRILSEQWVIRWLFFAVLYSRNVSAIEMLHMSFAMKMNHFNCNWKEIQFDDIHMNNSIEPYWYSINWNHFLFYQYLYIFLFNFVLFFQQFSENPDNQSLSVLTYTPSIEDDGKYLTCRAENSHIPNSMIEDKWALTVHCKYTWARIFLSFFYGNY